MPRLLFTPRWIAFHLLVAFGIVTMVWLGFWQLRRLDDRQEFNDLVAARAAAAPAPLDELLADGAEPSDLQWRRAVVRGTWGTGQVIVFNRTQDGIAGDNVLAPFVTDDGSVVLVNRGFVPIGGAVSTPTGDAEIVGTVRASQQRTRGGLTDAAPDGAPLTEVRRIDIERLAPQFGGELASGGVVAPVYLDLLAAEPPITDDDPRPVPGPERSNGPHLTYAVQWFIFAACVAIGWVFAVRRSLARHRAGSGQDRVRRDRSDDRSEPPAVTSPHDGIDVTS
jgi:cytochrome oxidase assembly protein ShyY1